MSSGTRTTVPHAPSHVCCLVVPTHTYTLRYHVPCPTTMGLAHFRPVFHLRPLTITHLGPCVLACVPWPTPPQFQPGILLPLPPAPNNLRERLQHEAEYVTGCFRPAYQWLPATPLATSMPTIACQLSLTSWPSLSVQCAGKFFRNFTAILVYALFGTLISTAVIALLTYYVGGLVFQLQPIESVAPLPSHHDHFYSPMPLAHHCLQMLNLCCIDIGH